MPASTPPERIAAHIDNILWRLDELWALEGELHIVVSHNPGSAQAEALTVYGGFATKAEAQAYADLEPEEHAAWVTTLTSAGENMAKVLDVTFPQRSQS